jgi:hypothetical protein
MFLSERSGLAGGLDGVGRDAEVEASEIEEGTVAFMQDGEFDLRGLQLGGDDEWAALEHGQRRAADQRDGHRGILYVCFSRSYSYELNCCADCSQSEKEGSPPS